MKTKLRKCCIPWSKERNYLVDIFALAFGLGAWVSVTGFWVELPLLIAHLPEEWRISSQLSVAIQMANIGPIIIALLAWFKKGQNESDRGLSLNTRIRIIYFLLILGIVANCLLAFEWNATVIISEHPHSVALIALMFSVGLIGCTSPVLFMPLMGIFPQKHLVSYLVGEGLGGFVPSMVALIQGVEESAKKSNSTIPSDENDSFPRFNPTVYFLFIASLMLIATVSFFLLNNLNATKKEMIHSQNTMNAEVVHNQTVDSTNAGETYTEREEFPFDEIAERNGRRRALYSEGQYGEIENLLPCRHSQKKPIPPQVIRRLSYILSIQGWICFFSSGWLPGVSTFASLPYGNQAFHLTAALGAAIVPIGCSIAFLRKHPPSIAFICGINIVATLLSVYTITIASYSPNPPLLGTTIGEALIVTNMVLYNGLSAYIKTNAARVCREIEISLPKESGIKEGSGRGPLFWCGAVSQGFATLGSIIDFVLVTVLKVFKSK